MSQPEPKQPEVQVLPPAAAQAPATTGSYTISQSTTVQQSIPPGVWTTELAEKYFTMVKDNDDQNRTVFENQKKREHQLAWAGVVLVAGIICFGCYLTLINNSLGKDIIVGTVIFLAGFLAGQGSQKRF